MVKRFTLFLYMNLSDAVNFQLYPTGMRLMKEDE